MKQSFCRMLPAIFLLGVLLGCNGRPPPPTILVQPAPPPAPVGPPLMRDVTEGAGLSFTYRNGEESGHLAILESLGGGAALIDHDRDGLLDLFLPGGGHYGGTDKRQILGHPCKLFRNLGGWKFKDVTADVGLNREWFSSHAAAVADVDRDGWPDLLVTGWGGVVLLRNVPADANKGRRFEDVTAKAGLDRGIDWATSAAFSDLDGDGYPDLYVCQYVDWSWKKNPPCNYDGTTPDVCPPKSFESLVHRVYHNQGDGTFREVGKAAGLRGPREEADYAQLRHLDDEAKDRLRTADRAGMEKDYGKGLGVLIVDVNADGRPDIYVANDTVDNLLYLNKSRKGQILLDEIGLVAGVARDDRGRPNGSMGVDAGDFDGTGRPSFFVTNYDSEKHALYRNECQDGREFFLYSSQLAGIAALGQTYVGWGTQFVDLDLDGWLDLVLVNGHAIRYPKGKSTLQQRALLLRNVPSNQGPLNRRFIDISTQGGSYFESLHRARGAAFGDLDNDGRLDMVVNHLNEPVALLRGTAPAEQHWLGVELAGKDNACVVGARVILEADGRKQTRFARGGGSYASSNDTRHLFGLDRTDKVESITVVWPSGQQQTWKGLAVDRYWKLSEGEKDAK